MSDRRERDLVLAPNEYAFISDQTKGNVNVYVGPHKTSLANTDQPVYFNDRSKRFESSSLDRATKLFATAPEGWYMIMKNPAQNREQPSSGTVHNLTRLEVGHKINIPGPVSFALWPGQMVRVVRGHHLRSNQYILVRVYDEESARQSWGEGVIKTKGDDGELLPDDTPENLTMGTKLLIKGTEVSFYIPPTGVEVVRDAQNNYVREAVTLERLEYCILLNEDGNKRFIRGPAVVFPEPTETFVARHGQRKFRAIELNELSGIYVKVIAPYEEDGESFAVGQELFITGKEQMIYFPRTEHAIIKYGEREIHYAVAIPAGEGRYCLDRQSGRIRLINGPTMFLPDPRTEVIVRRVLDPGQVRLWFPGNQEALEYNTRLKHIMSESEQDQFVDDRTVRNRAAEGLALDEIEEEAREAFAGDDFNRKSQFTPPRTITLNTKYEGAVTISPWTGYACMVVSKSGDRKVIAGPQTYLLEYNETLESMGLSTGTPKVDDRLFKTVYLRVLHNKVSDVVEAETLDLVKVNIRLSYRVNFEGDSQDWFNVENYVKFLTDHMRSVIRNSVKRVGVETFYADSINIVRDTVLGTSEDGNRRPGRTFEENGMRIYDVEVLDVSLEDAEMERLLTESRHAAVRQNLEVERERRRLDYVQTSETIKQQIIEARAQTQKLELETKSAELRQQLDVRLTELDSEIQTKSTELNARMERQSTLSSIKDAELSRERAEHDLALAVAQQELDQHLREIQAEVDAIVAKAGAVSPELIAALQAFSDRALVERVSASMAPLAILGGDSVAEVLGRLLRGTPLEHVARLTSTGDDDSGDAS